MKKKVLIIVSICILSFSLIAASNYYKDPENNIEKVQYEQTLENTKKNSKVLVKVGNDIITENDLKIAKIFNSQNLSDDQLLDNLVKDKAFLIEGKKQNLVPSDAEVQNRVNDVRNKIKDFPEALKQIKDYEQGLGISDDEYWNKVVFNAYKDRITSNNLIRKENKLSKTNNKNETYKQTIDRLYNNLKKAYNITTVK